MQIIRDAERCGRSTARDKSYRKNVRLVVSSLGYSTRLMYCNMELKTRLHTFHCHWYSSTVGGLVFFFGFCSDTSPFLLSSPALNPLFPSPGCWSELFPSGCPTSTAISSSNLSNSSFVEGSPNSFTAGNPIRSDLSFNVNRGPISCNAAFSVDRKAYLKACE